MEAILSHLIDKFNYWQLIGLAILYIIYKNFDKITDCNLLLKQMKEHFLRMELKLNQHIIDIDKRDDDQDTQIKQISQQVEKTQEDIGAILELLSEGNNTKQAIDNKERRN